jgi:isopenicillin N synthase-like dioxygenase
MSAGCKRRSGTSAGEMTDRMTTIPTFDLRDLAPNAADRAAALDRLRRTVGTIGAFYLVGHGVDPEQADRLFALSRRFFGLPDAAREAIAMVNSPHFRGYTAVGNELTQGNPDWREEVDIGAERPPRCVPGEAPYWGLQGPNLWPAELPDLRPAVLAWIDGMTAVAVDLVRALAECLGLPRRYFDDAFEPDPHLLLKLIRYPGRAGAYAGQGVGIHKDSGFLTFVLQDDRGGSGLQFFDGAAYVDVVPQRGAFVINLGEALELATNCRLHATLHRVESPAPGRDYFSIPFFYNPRFDYIVAPLDLSADLLPLRHVPPAVDPANPIFAEYGYNALKGRLRSHRDVAERFYGGAAAPPIEAR